MTKMNLIQRLAATAGIVSTLALSGCGNEERSYKAGSSQDYSKVEELRRDSPDASRQYLGTYRLVESWTTNDINEGKEKEMINREKTRQAYEKGRVNETGQTLVYIGDNLFERYFQGGPKARNPATRDKKSVQQKYETKIVSSSQDSLTLEVKSSLDGPIVDSQGVRSVDNITLKRREDGLFDIVVHSPSKRYISYFCIAEKVK